MTKMLKVVGASWLQTKISSYVLGGLGVLAIIALFLGEQERIQDDGNYAATVFYSEKSGYRIEYWGQSNELATVAKGVARAYYRQDIDTTGWAQLEIETDPSYKDKVQAYAAGLLEGALTWQTVYAHLQSTVHAECNKRSDKACDRVKDQLERAASIDKNNAAKYEDDDPFWHQVGLFYDQIDGIYTGWKYGVERSHKEYEMDITDLYWLNAVSEIREIKKRLNITIEDDVNEYLPGLSSAFLKIVNDSVEKDNVGTVRKLLVAHNTAGKYTSMIRILKRYKLNYHETDAKDSPLVAGPAVEFSGYPATITSHDDMFILSGGNRLLAITGTTINNFNKQLWRKVNIIDQVPIGPRVSAANRLAANVSSWVHILARNNSDTACKQWMVVDLKLLNKPIDQHKQNAQPVVRSRNTRAVDQRRELDSKTEIKMHVENDVSNIGAVKDNVGHGVVYITENKSKVKHTTVHRGSSRVKGLFWLLEQVPGYAHSGDLSDALLDRGYWATYGLPYFTDIANHTHLPEKERQFGNIFSYSESPRAAIFRQVAKNATTIEHVVHFMRNNNMSLLSNDSNVVDVEVVKSQEKAGANAKVKCDDNTLVESKMDCVMNEKQYWVNLAVRGDLAHKHKEAFGVIDTKVFSGDGNGIDDFAAISGPAYKPAPHDNSVGNLNKGNVALQAKQSQWNSDKLIADETHSPVDKEVISDVLPPFRWSTSMFADEPHDVQPDTFAFQPFRPVWVW